MDQLLLTQLVEEKLPELFQYLTSEGVMLQSCTVRWLLCIFVGVCPTETTARSLTLTLTLTLIGWACAPRRPRRGRDTATSVCASVSLSL